MENGMSLRSNTGKVSTLNQHDQLPNMATENSKEAMPFKTPAKVKGEKTRGDKTKSDRAPRTKPTDKLKINSKSNKDKEKDMANLKEPLNRNLFETEVTKGYVAGRVETINNTPDTSPATSPAQCKNLQPKKKMLSTRNGQLVLEEDDMQNCFSVQEGSHEHDDNESTEETYSPQARSNNSSMQETLLDEEISDSTDLPVILRELTATVKKLERSVRIMDKKNSEQQQKYGTLEAVQMQDSVKLRGIIESIDDQDDKINALIGIVLKQEHQIRALNSKWDAAYAKENRNNIIINGIPETQGENCYHETANFFKNVLKVDKQVPITQAYRTGVGKTRPIVAKLKSVADKAELYKKTDRLKQINRGREKPYYIADQLPEAWAEKRRSVGFLKHLNHKLPHAQQQKAEIKKGILSFNDKPYEPPVKAPTFMEICNLSAQAKRQLREMQFEQGEEELLDQSRFVGFSADAYSVQQVRKLYLAMKLFHPMATHIICAFKLPGIDVSSNQGFVDDGEHGAGRTLLNVLLKAKANNKALFVTRQYGGKHIGPVRFKMIENTAQSALDNLLKIEERNRKPLTAEELQQLNEQIAEQAKQQEQRRMEQEQNPWNNPTSPESEETV